MDFSLTPQEQDVLNDARAAYPALAACAAEADRDMRFPVEDLPDLLRHGLLALAIPKKDGGRGASTVAYVLACETIASADASLAIAWVMHIACGWEIAHELPEPARGDVLRDIVQNGAFVCIAGAEGRNEDGSPAPLKVVPEGGGWRLDGRKGFASGSEAATYVLTGGTDPEGKHQSFLVRMDSPGVSITERWDGMGMRASASNGIGFSGCMVSEGYHLTSSYKAGDFRNTSALFGLGLAATALGIGRAALDFTVEWSRKRPMSDAKNIRLGDMDVRLEAVRSLLWRAAGEADRDAAAAEPWVDRAKTLAVETAQQVTVDALRVCGGNAFRQKYSLERNARDADALLLQGQRPDQLRIGLAHRLLADSEPDDAHHPNAPAKGPAE
jgi:alkylation response protein AidB-like acyl-CoA dehydrogenase